MLDVRALCSAVALVITYQATPSLAEGTTVTGSPRAPRRLDTPPAPPLGPPYWLTDSSCLVLLLHTCLHTAQPCAIPWERGGPELPAPPRDGRCGPPRRPTPLRPARARGRPQLGADLWSAHNNPLLPTAQPRTPPWERGGHEPSAPTRDGRCGPSRRLTPLGPARARGRLQRWADPWSSHNNSSTDFPTPRGPEGTGQGREARGAGVEPASPLPSPVSSMARVRGTTPTPPPFKIPHNTHPPHPPPLGARGQPTRSSPLRGTHSEEAPPREKGRRRPPHAPPRSPGTTPSQHTTKPPQTTHSWPQLGDPRWDLGSKRAAGDAKTPPSPGKQPSAPPRKGKEGPESPLPKVCQPPPPTFMGYEGPSRHVWGTPEAPPSRTAAGRVKAGPPRPTPTPVVLEAVLAAPVLGSDGPTRPQAGGITYIIPLYRVLTHSKLPTPVPLGLHRGAPPGGLPRRTLSRPAREASAQPPQGRPTGARRKKLTRGHNPPSNP